MRNLRNACIAIVVFAVAVGGIPLATADGSDAEQDETPCYSIQWACEPGPCIYTSRDPVNDCIM